LIVLAAVAVHSHRSSVPARAVSYPAGWNLVAGPEGSRLNGAAGPTYTFRPGDTAYEVLANTTPLPAGWGYWAYFPDRGEVILGQGGDTQVSLATNQLTLVGSPYADGDASITSATLLYTYAPDTGYQRGWTIPVGAGAWAAGRTSRSINVSMPVALPSGL